MPVATAITVTIRKFFSFLFNHYGAESFWLENSEKGIEVGIYYIKPSARKSMHQDPKAPTVTQTQEST